MTTSTKRRTTAGRRRTLQLVLAGVAGAVLVGCGSESPAPVGEPRTDSSASSPSPESLADDGPESSESSAPAGSSESPDTTGSGAPSSESAGDGDADGDESSGTSDGSGVGLEMPVEPEAEVESLSELLDQVSTGPLVRTPLPGPASARGRLVAGYPSVLRPTRASAVATSSVSPAGDRLQVGLVASTTLPPERVLLAYRTRLARRGLVEQSSPATAAGSEVAAFRRGGSTITVTVTSTGAGTEYNVHATLHAPGA